MREYHHKLALKNELDELQNQVSSITKEISMLQNKIDHIDRDSKELSKVGLQSLAPYRKLTPSKNESMDDDLKSLKQCYNIIIHMLEIEERSTYCDPDSDLARHCMDSSLRSIHVEWYKLSDACRSLFAMDWGVIRDILDSLLIFLSPEAQRSIGFAHVKTSNIQRRAVLRMAKAFFEMCLDDLMIY